MSGLGSKLILCNLVILAATSLCGGTGTAEGANSVQYEQQIELNGEFFFAKVRHIDYKRTLESQDDAKYVQPLRDVLVELHPLSSPAVSKVVWWRTSPVQLEGVVTGKPIYALAVFSIEDTDFLLLVVANSYYRGARVTVIDTHQEISDPPSASVAESSSAITSGGSQAPSAVVTRSLDPEPHDMYGTKELNVDVEGNRIVILSIDASGKKHESKIEFHESDRLSLTTRARLRRGHRE